MLPDASQRLEKRLARAVSRAVTAFQMLQDGDRVLVAVSGGKDSITLLHLLRSLASRAPIRFSVLAVHLDQGQPGHDPRPLERWLQLNNYDFRIVRDDTWSIVKAKLAPATNPCSLCSRLRRAVLYRVATELGCTRIALGHHREDALATLMMNLLFSGQLKSMPPKLVSDDGQHVVIRPLVYCAEHEIAAFASVQDFPILPCGLCGTQPDHQRKVVSELLAQLESKNPGMRASMLAALSNVRPSHLLDASLWRKLGLEVAREESGVEDSAQALREG